MEARITRSKKATVDSISPSKCKKQALVGDGSPLLTTTESKTTNHTLGDLEEEKKTEVVQKQVKKDKVVNSKPDKDFLENLKK